MAGFDKIIVPVTDLDRAKAFYAALLAVDPFVDSPYYVGYMVGEVQLGLAPGGPTGGSGALPYLAVGDIAAVLTALGEAGGTTVTEPSDVGGGMLVAVVHDPDGNALGLTQPPAG